MRAGRAICPVNPASAVRDLIEFTAATLFIHPTNGCGIPCMTSKKRIHALF
jgi:hypothetical protein